MNQFAYCGLNCTECPVYIATQTNDNTLKEKTAKEWSTLYAEHLPKPLEPNDINCRGCRSKNNFVGCKTCEIRKCRMHKGFKTCADCNEYSSCGMLNGFYSQNPLAKQNLEALKRGKD